MTGTSQALSSTCGSPGTGITGGRTGGGGWGTHPIHPLARSPGKETLRKDLIFLILLCFKRHEEIPQVKMFNLNLWKNKTYYMNFIHKNMNYMPL